MQTLSLHSIATWEIWAGFFAFIFLMIATDLFVLGGNKAHRISSKEALSWTALWVSLALLFNLALWLYVQHHFDLPLANKVATEFFTGYLIEKSLSVDNLFVFIMIFHYFKIPAEYQHRVLIYGVLGAVVLRLIMIFAGLLLIAKFHWILYIFGVFLLLTGVKMLVFADKSPDLSENPVVQWMSNHIRVTRELHQEKFFVMKNGLLHVTPLFFTFSLIEITDVVFAVDSIPAIFAITEDPFIVATSNIFAILGLRSLYFLLANMADRFHLLKYGIAIILIIIGCKMLVAPWFKIPSGPMLLVVASILAISMYLSLRIKPRQK